MSSSSEQKFAATTITKTTSSTKIATKSATDGETKEATDQNNTTDTTDNNNNNNPQSSNDFVIRDGFPALRNEKGEPMIEGPDLIPSASFLSYSSAFNAINGDDNDISFLLEDCRKIFSARTKEESAAYSAGCTYFIPPVMKPRCALEGLALEIFHQHTKDLPKGSFIPQQSGAEWWTLVLDSDPPKVQSNQNNDDEDDENDGDDDHDEVGMHFDADYGLEDQAPGLLIHPRVATITYLSNYGAPTLVLHQKSPPPNDVLALQGPVHSGWLSGPRIGKHVAFDGRLLHGAPATFFPGATAAATVEDEEPPAKRQKVQMDSQASSSSSSSSPAAAISTTDSEQGPERITFLVNIWLNHCPLDAELLDDEIVQQLKSPMDKKWGFVIDKPDETEKKTLGVYKEDPAGEEETIICERVVTLFYNEKMERQHAISQSINGKTYELEFTEGSLRIEVGGKAPTEESDEDDAE